LRADLISEPTADSPHADQTRSSPPFVATSTYVGAAILGGIAGALTIADAVVMRLDLECRVMNRGCDGQGATALIYCVPLIFGVGCLCGTLWTWFTVRFAEDNIYASVFTYRGEHRWLNRALGAIMSIGPWVLVDSYMLSWAIHIQ
jgi:hypothetical protein